MAASALDVVRAWYRSGDPALLAPEIDWRVLDSFPAGGNYRGRDAVLDRFFPAVLARFAAYETMPESFHVAGGTIVATGRYRVRGLTGVAAEADFAHIWTVKEGSIVAFRQIADTVAIGAAIGAAIS
ncbi:nuclear transport factor 2 family protein [Sphingomonas sp. M6A6_1c]